MLQDNIEKQELTTTDADIISYCCFYDRKRTCLDPPEGQWVELFQKGKISDHRYFQWRIVMAVALNYFFIYSMVVNDKHREPGQAESRLYWLTWLTSWTLVLNWISGTLSLAVMFLTPDKDNVPLLLKLQWGLWPTSLITSFWVCILYWAFFDISTYPATGAVWVNRVQAHGGPFVFYLIDLFMSNYPLFFRHIYISYIYTMVYMIFNAIYVYGGHKSEFGESYIYEQMDWKEDIEGVFLQSLGLFFIAIPFSYLMFIGIRVYCVPGGEPGSKKTNEIDEEGPQVRVILDLIETDLEVSRIPFRSSERESIKLPDYIELGEEKIPLRSSERFEENERKSESLAPTQNLEKTIRLKKSDSIVFPEFVQVDLYNSIRSGSSECIVEYETGPLSPLSDLRAGVNNTPTLENINIDHLEPQESNTFQSSERIILDRAWEATVSSDAR